MRAPRHQRSGRRDHGAAGRPSHPDAPGEPTDRRSDQRPTDPLDLRLLARRQPRTAGRLHRLVRDSIRLTWQADRRLFTLTALLQLGGSALLAAQVLLVQWVLDAVLSATSATGSISDVVVPIALLALVTAIVSVTGALQANGLRVLGELVVERTWQQLLDVVGAVELRAFESPAFFDRLQRVQANALSRPFQLTQGLLGLVGGAAGAVGLAGAVVVLEPLLLPLLVLAGIPVLLTTRRESRLEFDFAVRQTPRLRLRQYLAVLQTGRDEAKEVRAFDLQATLRDEFFGVYDAYLRDLRAHVRRRTALAVAGNLGAALVLGLTMLAVVGLVVSGRITLAAAGAALVAVRLLAGQVQRLLKGGQQVFESGLFLDDLDEFAAIPRERDQSMRGETAPGGFDVLVAEDLGFTYPGSDVPALHGVNVQLEAGEVVALVGENGSGKTTLAKVLAGLYPPTTGAVRWDGRDVSGLDPRQLRRAIAVIFQDFVRYALPAADNIGLGRVARRRDREGIRRAARETGVDAALSSLPRGYDTILSRLFHGGGDLSVGQWQRVALARAYFRDAPFVILDEPTAALDPRAEHGLFQSLRGVLAGRTVLFISHRFSTVRSADRIYVLRDGRVAEHGTHDQLMAADGHYAELFRLQAAAYLSAEADPAPA